MRIALIFLFLLMPSISLANLVPCDGPECQACHFVEMGQRILNFLVLISISIAVLMIAIGGLLMVVSAGNQSSISSAKGMMSNAIIGVFIVLAAWLIINTIMQVFYDPAPGFENWNQIECKTLPDYYNPTSLLSRPTAASLTPEQIAALNLSGTYYQQVCQAATQQGLGSQCSHLQAIMAVESNSNPNAISSVGCVGLMQVCPSTACQLNNNINGCSGNSVSNQAAVVSYLQNPTNNIALGVQMYNNLYTQYGTNYNYIYAAYNGGIGANSPSSNCSSGTRWQCLWDDDAHTIPNTGYQETRNYVQKVTAVQNNAISNP